MNAKGIAKINSNYTCQECGSTEFIQAHHQIPKDDNRLIVLCAKCNSAKHPDVPRALFFIKNHQPYWHNKSASSLSKSLGVHSRTVIRWARKLHIVAGEITTEQVEQIKSHIIPHTRASHIVIRDGEHGCRCGRRECIKLRNSVII